MIKKRVHSGLVRLVILLAVIKVYVYKVCNNMSKFNLLEHTHIKTPFFVKYTD